MRGEKAKKKNNRKGLRLEAPVGPMESAGLPGGTRTIGGGSRKKAVERKAAEEEERTATLNGIGRRQKLQE